MKKTNLIFWAGIILLAVFSLVQANHRVAVVTFCGDQGIGVDNCFWDDVSLNDSICRTELHVDTIINLFYDGTFVRGDTFLHYIPKYKVSFVDGPATLAKLDSVTGVLASTLESTDFLIVWIQGHGLWESIPGRPGYHSDVDELNGYLTDDEMAAYFNRINAYKVYILEPCETDGNGRSPDSSGFLTWLGFHAPDSISHKTIILSAAGPQPAWTTMNCDDKAYPNGPEIPGLENEWYNGSEYYHSEFSFHILTSLNGGAEPSEYYSHHGAPGFFFDSIDVNHDGQITVAEAFAWDRHRNSQLGLEDNQMLDLGHLADSMIVWPHIGWIESTGIQEPRTTPPVSPSLLPPQTIMFCSSFSAWLARPHGALIFYDMSGRRVQPGQVQSGVYFWRAKTGPTYKLILTN